MPNVTDGQIIGKHLKKLAFWFAREGLRRREVSGFENRVSGDGQKTAREPDLGARNLGFGTRAA